MCDCILCNWWWLLYTTATLLTDYIEASGGPSELITVLNRLVASSETLDRHIMRVSAQHKQEGLLNVLDGKSLTVATTDNIDFLQSHASVYSGSQHRSWHATSVEVVQPRPSLKTMVVQPNTEVATMDMSPLRPSTSAIVPTPHCNPTVISRDHPVALHNWQRQKTSPISSPSKLRRSTAPKRVKRARTIHEAVRLGEMDESNPGSLHVDSRQTTSMGCLRFEDFLQSDEEIAALEKIKNFFYYVLHKSALKPDHLLFSFKDHIAAMVGENIHSELSVVVYFPIVDMHADTIEAMSEVAAMLYKEYTASTGAQHLVVAGDAKTYLV